MFTNKRQLKKYIHNLAGDMVEIVLPGAVLTGKISEEKAQEIIEKISQLTSQAQSRLSIAFDKAPSAFDSVKAYHAARRAYYKEAYAKAVADFEAGITAIISELK